MSNVGSLSQNAIASLKSGQHFIQQRPEDKAGIAAASSVGSTSDKSVDPTVEKDKHSVTISREDAIAEGIDMESAMELALLACVSEKAGLMGQGGFHKMTADDLAKIRKAGEDGKIDRDELHQLLGKGSLAPAKPAAPESYTVKPGDSLSKIAKQFAGDPMKWKELHAANPWLKNPNLIKPGQKLTIPDSWKKAAPTAPTAPAPKAPTANAPAAPAAPAANTPAAPAAKPATPTPTPAATKPAAPAAPKPASGKVEEQADRLAQLHQKRYGLIDNEAEDAEKIIKEAASNGTLQALIEHTKAKCKVDYNDAAGFLKFASPEALKKLPPALLKELADKLPADRSPTGDYEKAYQNYKKAIA